MGFFNKILKGLGFEDEENEEKQKKQKVTKDKVKTNNNNVYASFDLNQEEDTNLTKQSNVSEQEVPKHEEVPQSESDSNFGIFRVKSQVEVQMIVDKLKNGEKILLNLTEMSSSDLTRSLDFLTGAVYALNKSMQKVDGNVYLIQ